MTGTTQTYMNGKSYLELHRVAENASGVFDCVVSNGIGSPHRRGAKLRVRRAPRLDRSSPFRRAAGQTGKSAALRCRAEGAPAVGFYWRLASEPDRMIEKGRRFRMHHLEIDVTTYEVEK